MKKKLRIKFASTGKIFQFQPKTKVKIGENVLVKTLSGLEVGKVLPSCSGLCPNCSQPQEEMGEFLRVLNQEDKKEWQKMKEKARLLIPQVQEIISQHSLPMKILDAEFSLDMNKLIFYFQSETRVDFRLLVGELAARFQKLIRFQQVGVRDQAKILGGFGPCGRPLCCQFLVDLEQIALLVSKKVEREYGKYIIGPCGRPCCCLIFEDKK